MTFFRLFCICLMSVYGCCHVGYARTGRALIVAIGEYPAENGWERIHGENDGAMMVELLGRNHYQQIILLQNEKATKAAINLAFERLCEDTKQGDYIFLHFSCHGQQMMDLNGDEEDGLDEALIPYDALYWYLPGVYEGKNHLCDDELGIWIDRLRHKAGSKGQVFVLLDACHSGTANRYTFDVFIRGTNKIFAPDDYRPHPGKFLHRSMKLKPDKNQAPTLVLSACKAGETNYEYYSRKSRSYYGKLTYSFVRLVEGGASVFTADAWCEAVDETMQQLSSGRFLNSQHPYMECSDVAEKFVIPVFYYKKQ